MIDRLLLRTPAARWKIAALERLLTAWRWFKRVTALVTAAVALLLVVQVVYPRQLVRPFVQVDKADVGGWSSGRLAQYLNTSVSPRPYQLAIAGRDYQMTPAALGLSVNATDTTAAATDYSWGQRLTPFSLFRHERLHDQKTVDMMRLNAGLQQFAAERAQDPEDATVTKQDGIYSSVVPGKPGYIVDVRRLQAALLAAVPGSRLTVPRIAVQPKITQSMVNTALDSWRQQTKQPIELLLGVQVVTIPASTLQNWAIITPDQKQDAVLVTYDTGAIKNWLAGYASRVYVAPKTATTYIVDGAVSGTQPGANGSALDLDKSAAAVVAAFQGPTIPVRLATASLQTLPFTTRQVRGYSPTSKGLQLLINDWGRGYRSGSVAVSLQEIGGQGRSTALNDGGQFFTASIYKLFVVAYTYHLLENGQLSPDTLVLGAGKSVATCLQVTIVVSDNTCPEALGGQLGWINIQAYAEQQGFTATSLVDHNWSTDTHDVAAYLGKLQAGSLISAGDTAALLNNMQNQVYRSAIPAGSPGSVVQDKVGFYGTVWHDAAIVHGPKATYILVVFTNGPGAGAIKNLAAQIQQTIDQ